MVTSAQQKAASTDSTSDLLFFSSSLSRVLMSRWRPGASSIPWGSVLGLWLFNTFASDMDSASKFADDSCSWCSWGKGCHSEGPQQGWSGPVPASWGSTRPSARSCTCLRTISCTNTGMDWRASLSRRTWVCWLMRSSIWPSNICLQPRKPIVF